MFFNKNDSNFKATKRVEFPLYGKRSGIPQKQEAIIMAWALVDLAYYIIKTSNDYRGKSIEFEQELYMLQIVVDTYKEREESIFLDTNKEEMSTDFFMYIWGFAGEQFKFQNPKIVFDNFSRDLYMLFELNDSSKFDTESVIQKEIGVSWEKVITYLMMAWYGFTQSSTMKELIEKITWSDLYIKDEFENRILSTNTQGIAISGSLSAYNENKFYAIDGKALKACDKLAAFFEAGISISYGVSNAELKNGFKGVLSSFEKLSNVEGVDFLQICKDFKEHFGVNL